LFQQFGKVKLSKRFLSAFFVSDFCAVSIFAIIIVEIAIFAQIPRLFI